METKKTALGLSENIEGALAYIGWWVTGLVFWFLEPENRFVRFHAMQSIVVFGAITIAAFLLGLIPVIGWILSPILWLAGVVLWLWLMYKAYQGELYKLPWAGDFAEQQVNK
ncbi:MAG: DUF4870 domain-containing protein [Anaerolineae bacterium]